MIKALAASKYLPKKSLARTLYVERVNIIHMHRMNMQVCCPAYPNSRTTRLDSLCCVCVANGQARTIAFGAEYITLMADMVPLCVSQYPKIGKVAAHCLKAALGKTAGAYAKACSIVLFLPPTSCFACLLISSARG